MDENQYSLSNLRDIVIPDAPPFWPPAAGAWVALGMVAAILLLVAWRLHTVRNRNAYRKAGLMLLGSVQTAYDVSVVLKRVALAVFPREQVASLYGDDWAGFLHKTCPQSYFKALVTGDSGAEPGADLVELASTWIRHHRVPKATVATG
jgi:hypothetical protein